MTYKVSQKFSLHCSFMISCWEWMLDIFRLELIVGFANVSTVSFIFLGYVFSQIQTS